MTAILRSVYTYLGLPSTWFAFEETSFRICCTQAPPTMGVAELVFFREPVLHVYIYIWANASLSKGSKCTWDQSEIMLDSAVRHDLNYHITIFYSYHIT